MKAALLAVSVFAFFVLVAVAMFMFPSVLNAVASLSRGKSGSKAARKEQFRSSRTAPTPMKENPVFREKRKEAIENNLKQVQQEAPPAVKYLHPLQRARLHSKGPVARAKHRYVVKTSRKRKLGAEQTEGEVELEDYDLTDDMPYEDVKVFNVPGDGDCLFHCVRTALKEIKIEVSIEDLRGIVARSVGEKELGFLRSIYTSALREGDRSLLRDYSFMKNVETVRDLRSAIMTTEYYGDEMALQAIERAYPMKLLVVRSLANDRLELARRFSADEAEEESKPWFCLLLLNVFAQHYELISYESRVAMRKDELPPKIHRLVDQQKEERRLAELKRERENKNKAPPPPRPLRPEEKLERIPFVSVGA